MRHPFFLEELFMTPDHQRTRGAIVLCALITGSFALLSVAQLRAQMPDMAQMQKWAAVTIVHYEVTGVANDKHVQIPAADADQYGDVEEKLTLSFDWDKNKKKFVGTPKFVNHPAKITNLQGMEKGCPGGELNGTYEHFDIVSMKVIESGAIELTGVRKHPDTMVAESCGSGRKLYKGTDKPVSMWIAPPDPVMLAMGSAMGAGGPVKISPDGKSMIMTAQNDNWVWTYTPSAK